MRIISNFHDYYDCVQGYGVDKTVIYIRNSSNVNNPKMVDHLRSFILPWYFRYGKAPCRDLSIGTYVIVFCGKVYPVVRMKNIYGGHPLNGYYYNLDELKDKVSRVTSAAIYAAYISKSGRATYDYSHATDLCLRRLFNSIMKKSNVFLEMAGDSPIVVFNFAEESMAVCPLRDYHFYKVFDTYAAFQEIHSFLASKASPEKSMPVIPDVLKAQSKGFDKWSFRKPPTRKK